MNLNKSSGLCCTFLQEGITRELISLSVDVCVVIILCMIFQISSWSLDLYKDYKTINERQFYVF